MKKVISLLIISVLCMCLFVGTVSAKIAEPTNTLKTNGNGGKTDVGAWYITYNTESMWSDNFGSGYPVKYRTLMPDGSYGILDSSNIEHIDFQLEQLAEAKVDFILFDLTNGGLTSDVPYGWSEVKGRGNKWIVDNAKLTCERIALWNDTHDWKIKYAVAVGAYVALRGNLSIGKCTEYQAKAVYNDFFLNPAYGGDDHYQVDGKPLLIIHDWGENVLTVPHGWNKYTGDRTYGDKFTVRNGQCGQAGTYGWQTANGTQVDDEVEVVCPGQNTAGPSKANIYRDNGNYYRTSWEAVLNNTLPRIVMIASFNDYNEQTGVFTADSSSCRDGIEEKWTDETGEINNSMYWDMTKEGINLVRIANGEIKGSWTSAWFDLGNGRPTRTATTSSSSDVSSTDSDTSTDADNSIDTSSDADANSAPTQNNDKVEVSDTENSNKTVIVVIVITITVLFLLALAAVVTILILKSKNKVTVQDSDILEELEDVDDGEQTVQETQTEENN